jgi:hypothetical protein
MLVGLQIQHGHGIAGQQVAQTGAQGAHGLVQVLRGNGLLAEVAQQGQLVLYMIQAVAGRHFHQLLFLAGLRHTFSSRVCMWMGFSSMRVTPWRRAWARDSSSALPDRMTMPSQGHRLRASCRKAEPPMSRMRRSTRATSKSRCSRMRKPGPPVVRRFHMEPLPGQQGMHEFANGLFVIQNQDANTRPG